MSATETLGKIWFNLTLFLLTLIPFLTSLPVLLIGKFVPSNSKALDISERIQCFICQYAWWLLFRINPHMRLVFQNYQEAWSNVGKSGKPVMVLINHASFLDAMLYCAFCPTWTLVQKRTRTLASVGIMRLPCIGQLVASCGHIGVNFSAVKTGTTTSDDFSVDSASAQKMMGRVNKHLDSGNGWLCMCPEGKLNQGSGRQLQPFRFGGFKTVEEYDMEVWGFGLANCSGFWPAASLGGSPSKIIVNMFPIFPNGAKAYIEGLDEKEKQPEDSGKPGGNFKILARDAQHIFQKKLDSFWADTEKDESKCKNQ